jgi:hypothetical protein
MAARKLAFSLTSRTSDVWAPAFGWAQSGQTAKGPGRVTVVRAADPLALGIVGVSLKLQPLIKSILSLGPPAPLLSLRSAGICAMVYALLARSG